MHHAAHGHDRQGSECAKISLWFVYSNAQRSYCSTVNHSGCCSGVDVEEAAVTQSSGEGHRAEKCSVLRGSRIAAAVAMCGSDSHTYLVSEMHFNALRSLTQPCMTAYCPYHSTYDPGASPGSANQCILGDVRLRSNL